MIFKYNLDGREFRNTNHRSHTGNAINFNQKRQKRSLFKKHRRMASNEEQRDREHAERSKDPKEIEEQSDALASIKPSPRLNAEHVSALLAS